MLFQTIVSILSQTYQDFELIVLDDGSTDDSAKVIEEFQDKRIAYYNYGKIGNLSKLRNLGIKLSKYEYIAFCDDDDLWRNDKLEMQITQLKEYDIVCSNSDIIDIDNKVIKKQYFLNMNEKFVITNQYLVTYGNIVLTPSLVFKKDLVTANNIYFDEQKYTNLCEDYEFLIRLTEVSDILFFNKNLVSVRFHNSVSGGIENNIKMVKSGINILKDYTIRNIDNKKKKLLITEGILRYKIFLTKLSFKRNISSGLSELLDSIFFLFSFNAFRVFLKLCRYKIKSL